MSATWRFHFSNLTILDDDFKVYDFGDLEVFHSHDVQIIVVT